MKQHPLLWILCLAAGQLLYKFRCCPVAQKGQQDVACQRSHSHCGVTQPVPQLCIPTVMHDGHHDMPWHGVVAMQVGRSTGLINDQLT